MGNLGTLSIETWDPKREPQANRCRVLTQGIGYLHATESQDVHGFLPAGPTKAGDASGPLLNTYCLAPLASGLAKSTQRSGCFVWRWENCPAGVWMFEGRKEHF